MRLHLDTVHNFTTQTRILPQGQEFISVEFNRTTPLPRLVEDIKNQDELVSLGVRNLLLGAKGCAVKVFYKDLDRYNRRNEDFTPRLFWDKFPGESHESAMLGTEQRLDTVRDEIRVTVGDLTREVKRQIDGLRNIGLFASVLLLVALLAILLPLWYNAIGGAREAVARQEGEIKHLRERLLEQKNRLDAITVNHTAAPAELPPSTRR